MFRYIRRYVVASLIADFLTASIPIFTYIINKVNYYALLENLFWSAK